MVYIAMISLLGTSLWISLTQLQEHARTAVLYASVLIVPVMFISDTLPVAVLILAYVIAFCAIAGPRIDPEPFKWAAANLSIFATGGILIGHFVNKTRAERYIFAESAIQLAELETRYTHYDQMTGLRNRRAYSEKIATLSKELPEPAV